MPACPRREWEAKVRLDDAPRSFRISIMMTCAKAGRGLMSDLDVDVDWVWQVFKHTWVIIK